MRFYLGTHQPSWLARDLGIPLMVSHRRLTDRRTLPRASGPWALDSGGFTELSLHGRWRTNATTYIKAVRRYATEIGNLDWAAPRDWMTESQVLARTGLSLRTHQHRTVADYLRLRDLAPELPIIPVLQGQSITDYHRCVDLYERHGVDLTALPLVGVGSVCRRQHTGEVEQIMRSLAATGLRLHGFGVKITGLARYAETLSSADSASWSLAGRHTTGCAPSHRSESNCVHFATAWHTKLLHTLHAPPEELPVHTHTSTRTTCSTTRQRASTARTRKKPNTAGRPITTRPPHQRRPRHPPATTPTP